MANFLRSDTKISHSKWLKVAEQTIPDCSDQDLRRLKNQIVSVLNQRSQNRLAKAMSTFKIGDHISFSCDGTTYFGEVIKLNRKTIGIETEFDGHWNVSPAGLTILS